MIADSAAAVERLQKFSDTCQAMNAKHVAPTEAELTQLALQIPIVQAILDAVEIKLPDEHGRHTRIGETHQWRAKAALAATMGIGAIRDALEVERILGPTGPKLAAGSLQPAVWTASARLWDNEHRSAAVQRGATAVIELVRDMTGVRDLQDLDLVTQAFSSDPAAPGRPRLRWPGDDQDSTVKSVRTGLPLLARGLLQTVRNPSTHSTGEIPADEALEQLAALSLLARMIEKCEVLRAPATSSG